MATYLWSETPYFLEIARDLEDPRIEEVIVFKSAQIGFTRFLAAWLAYIGDTSASDTMLAMPTDEKAYDEQLNKFLPWFLEVKGLVRKSRKFHIRFTRGGNLYFSSAEKAKALKSKSCRDVAGDEIDEYPENVEGEGNPLKMLEARQIAKRGGHRLFGSTPRHAEGHIATRDKAANDKRDLWVNCPHCRAPQKLVWEQLKWLKIEAKSHKELAAEISANPAMVWYECIACEGRITESHKRKMITAAQWLSQTQTLSQDGVVLGARPVGTVATYRTWSIMSLWFSWAKLVRVWLDAVDDPHERKTVLSQYMGRLPVVRVIAPTVLGMMTRTQKEASLATGRPGIVPAYTGIVVGGADVQGDRLYWTLRAFGLVRSQLIAHGVTSDLDELKRLLDSTYPLASGGQPMRVAGLAIDFGGTVDKNGITAKQKIFKWAGHDARIMPAKGHANDSRDDFKVSTDETYARDYIAVQSIRIASRIFELRDAGQWELFAGVDQAYINSIDAVTPTISETGDRGFRYGERCDYFDAEVYSYSLAKYLTAKNPFPEESVLERLRQPALSSGKPSMSVADVIRRTRGASDDKKW